LQAVISVQTLFEQESSFIFSQSHSKQEKEYFF